MRFDVLTLFPDMFDALSHHGVTGRALARELWSLHTWNPRDFAHDPYKTVDDRPYGGGPGMVMRIEPLVEALEAAKAARGADTAPVWLMSPSGEPVNHARVAQFAESHGAIIICGRYEAIDQRFIDRYVDRSFGVADIVVSGGELPAMMLIDAIVRQRPGVLGDAQSAAQDSFVQGLLDCPHYTRPEEYEGERVPDVLLSGHHAKIADWRRAQSVLLTQKLRPDLILQARQAQRLSPSDEALLNTLKN